jgi:predicted nucleic-acid-binding protein
MQARLQQDDRIQKLFKNISQTNDGSVTSQLLFEFLGFIMGWKHSIKQDQYEFVKQLFNEKQIKIVENYEAKICHV